MDDNEHPTFDYDKLIAESTGYYREWWELWKRIHPEWAIQKKEPEIPPPAPKPQPTFEPLTCKRCDYIWTPRKKQKPVQCPCCRSPYWHKERVYRKN